MTEYPYGYCGMPCALCSRYHTAGKSRCPGCSSGGYYTDVCRVHHCCREKALSHCDLCEGFPCERLGKMGDFRDLNTHHAKKRTCESVARDGFSSWYADYAERASLLKTALEQYNDGRRKRYLCELFIGEELPVLREIMQRAAALQGTPKETAAAFKALADSLKTLE